jgi:hypothetical protein
VGGLLLPTRSLPAQTSRVKSLILFYCRGRSSSWEKIFLSGVFIVFISTRTSFGTRNLLPSAKAFQAQKCQ